MYDSTHEEDLLGAVQEMLDLCRSEGLLIIVENQLYHLNNFEVEFECEDQAIFITLYPYNNERPGIQIVLGSVPEYLEYVDIRGGFAIRDYVEHCINQYKFVQEMDEISFMEYK